MPKILDIHDFISQSKIHCVIDVRTPDEYSQGHIPKAINIPLFSNEERVVIGTLYKNEGKQTAILKGLEFVGPKMKDIIELAKTQIIDNTVFVHCWRGGMRSASVAWLLELYGFKVYLLKDGYKNFRQYVLNSFLIKQNITILGGNTGSGKTIVLQELQSLKEQIIDLENLAHHKGSAFGGLGEKVAPTQEQFENKLALQLMELDCTKQTWIEDESRLIGKAVIPPGLWSQMREAIVVFIDIEFDTRVKNLIDVYGAFSKEELEQSVLKISKRLGQELTSKAIEALHTNNLKMVCEWCLQYYDKSYDYGLKDRENLKLESVNCSGKNFKQIAELLITTTHG